MQGRGKREELGRGEGAETHYLTPIGHAKEFGNVLKQDFNFLKDVNIFTS